jgi:hypothetical protein
MDPVLFDQLEQTFTSGGADAALERLCGELRERRDYHGLFYALLLRKRHQLGLSPMPTGQDVPPDKQPAYEEAIREAGRLVGGLFLEAGNLPQAWAYFRMLGEPEPVRQALEKHSPGPEEDVQSLVQIAFYEGVHPKKGFDWVIERFGLCSAITTVSSQELPHPEEVKQYCLRRLVRALYHELRERLAAEIERHDGLAPLEASAPADTPGIVGKLIDGRDWLFEDDYYHIDTSHLSSVVQMSIHLTPSLELDLARELCGYGRRLSGRLTGQGDPPFEDLYKGVGHYLAILAGDDVEGNLDYFRIQADTADPENVGTYPAEVLVNLLLRLNRPDEALAVARKHLTRAEGRQLSCPGVMELCQKTGAWSALAETARERGDVVHFVAGLLGTRR